MEVISDPLNLLIERVLGARIVEAEGDVKASGEFFLREAERAADQLDLRRAFHALRDWEQGAAVPDQSTHAYLTVIARDPETVRKALSPVVT